MADNSRALPAFVADVMLGKLARWLRLYGFDTIYQSCISTDTLLDLAIKEKRILLTRNNSLLKKAFLLKQKGIDLSVIPIASDHFKDQLRQTLKEIGVISTFPILSRCARCNNLLREAKVEEVEEKVPEYIYQTQKDFYICEGCGQIYWGGTHIKGIKSTIDDVLKNL